MSRFWLLITNRYFTLITEGICVALWASLIFRRRSADEVVACTLVVMISLMIWGEILTRIVRQFGKYFNRRFGPFVNPPQPAQPASRFARIITWGFVVLRFAVLIYHYFQCSLRKCTDNCRDYSVVHPISSLGFGERIACWYKAQFD